MFGYSRGMFSGQCDSESVLRDALAALARDSRSGSLFDRLRATAPLMRVVERMQVETVAEMLRDGEFAARGYKQPHSAVAALLGIERGEAVQIVTAAESVCSRSTLQGEILPARLPAMAEVFAAGVVSVRRSCWVRRDSGIGGP